jgi:hypothetical protein
MATIQDIKAGLTGGKSEAERALGQLNGVVDSIDKAIAVLVATSAGSGQPKVAQAIAKLQQAKQKFAEGAASVRGAMADTDSYSAVL